MFLRTTTHSRLVASSLVLAAFLLTTDRIQAQAVLHQQQTIFTSDNPVPINATQDLAQTVTAGITGAMQVATLVIMTRLASG